MALVLKDDFLEIIISAPKVSCPCWQLIKGVWTEFSATDPSGSHHRVLIFSVEEAGRKILLYFHSGPWLETWEKSHQLGCIAQFIRSIARLLPVPGMGNQLPGSPLAAWDWGVLATQKSLHVTRTPGKRWELVTPTFLSTYVRPRLEWRMLGKNTCPLAPP